MVARCFLPHMLMFAHQLDTAIQRLYTVPRPPSANHMVDVGSTPSYGIPSTAFQTDNKELVTTATSINTRCLCKQHIGDPEESRKPVPFHVDTKLLTAVSAGQDTNHHKQNCLI